MNFENCEKAKIGPLYCAIVHASEDINPRAVVLTRYCRIGWDIFKLFVIFYILAKTRQKKQTNIFDLLYDILI